MTLWEASVGLETQAARLRRGDPEAFEELLRQYKHRLYRYLVRLSRDPTLAEDLFQQTWVRVVQRIRQYDPRRNFEAWLFSVARNLTIDHFRRYRPESLDEPLPGDPSGASRETFLAAAEPSALDRVLEHERCEKLTDVLSRLPWIYGEVITLRFEEEMKLEEIAETLDMPLSTVKTRLRRALEQLREALGVAPEKWQ